MFVRSNKSALLCAAIAAVVSIPSLLPAQTVYTGPNNGDWATGGNWSAGAPTGALNAQINNNASLVNVNLAASTTGNVNNLTIDAGDSLTLQNNSTLNIGGNLLGTGTLKFIASPNQTFLNFSSPTATIAGLIDFNYQTASPADGRLAGPGSGTLTNNGSIRGSGTFANIRFTNSASGLLENYQTGAQMYIDANNGGGGLFVNLGTIRALAGSTVSFAGDNGGDVNSTGGSIQANGAGAIVRFVNNASVTGGNYSTTGGGEILVEAGQAANASPQSLSGTWHVANNATLSINGAMTNNGTFNFTPAANVALMNLTGNLTLSGTGSLVGNYPGTGPGTRIDGGANILTLGANQTATGVIQFNNVRVVNNGIIDANLNRATLGDSGMYLDAYNGGGGLFVNNNIIRATNGGIVRIVGDNGGDLANNGTISAIGTGSLIRFQNNASATGGAWVSSGGGEIEVAAGHAGTLNAPSSLTGTVRVQDSATLTLNGTITNNAAIRLTTGGNLSLLNVNGPLTLNGTGSIVGEYSGAGTGPRIDGGANLITLGANQTVSGTVKFNNTTVTNNGLIDANTTAGIYVDPYNGGAGQFINNGTMRSSGGGIMQIVGDFGGDTINNGTILSTGTGSITELINSASVTGGTWSNASGGVIRVRPGHTGYLNGPLTLSPGSTFLVPANNVAGGTTLNLNGTVTGNGATLRLDAAGALSLLNLNGDVTLTTGTLLRGTYTNVSGTSPGPRIDATSNTLTVAAGATIDGVIYFNNDRLVNNGTITANNAAGMYVDPNNQAADLFINNNIMEATGGGLMQIAGDFGGNLKNNGTLRAVGAGSILELLNSITVVGGTISTSGGGVVRVKPGGTASLVGPATVSAGSTMTVLATNVSGGTTLNVSGNYTLNGTLDLNAAGALALLNVAGDTTLGTGTLNGLYTNIAGSPGPRIDAVSSTLTVSAASTIQGVVYFNNARVINNGLIDCNNVNGIYVDPNNQAAGLFVNNGTMRSSAGGLMVIAGDNGGDLVNNGTISSIGADSITELINSIAVTGGNWGNTSGGVIRVRPGHTAYLINPTVTAGSKFDVPGTGAQGGAFLYGNGTFTLNGVMDFSAQGAAPVFTTQSPVTLAGTGSLRGSFGGTGPGPRIDAPTNTLTVNAGATVEGVMFFNNARVINNGTILANNHAVPNGVGQFDMYLDPCNQAANLFVNNGTIRATNGAALGLTGDNGGNFTGNGPLIVDVNSVIGTWNSCGGDMGPVSGLGTYRASNSSNLGHTSFRVGTLEAINSATARVIAGATPGLAAGTSKVGTVTINTSGKVDLTNNGMVVTAMTAANVRALIAPARNNGQWNGANAIGSSLAFNNGKAIGYIQASDVYGASGSFLGQSFALTDVLVRFTFNGDTDLNGTVNFDDLLRVAQNYDTVATGTWFKGDFTYDGNINFDDLLGLAQQYDKTLLVSGNGIDVLGGAGGSAFANDWRLALSMVPEPTSLGLLFGAGFIARRRR